MAAFVKYQCFAQDVGRKVHNLHTDTLKVALTDTAPDVAADALLADAAEITAQNGYAAGGGTVAGTSYTQTAGVAKLAGADHVFTATGGSFGPFRYAVLYNSTPAGGPLIGYWDYGSSISLNDTQTFTVDFTDNANLLQVA